jgi:hypothetical protein
MSTIIDFLDITHRPVFLFKNNISETGIGVHSQVKATLEEPNQ